MGPGLLCFVVLLFGLFSLVRTILARRPDPVARAEELLREGQLEEARTVAYRAVALGRSAKAHFSLARILARQGDDEEALIHFRRAAAINKDNLHLRSLVSTNMSLTLRGLGKVDEALAEATEAVRIQEGLDSYPSPFLHAGAAWAHIALALAQTDAGQDGRPAAQEALRVFRSISGHDFADGMAHAYYANAYAYRAQGGAEASKLAREAWQRFKRLHARFPALYRDRLAQSERLMHEGGRPRGRMAAGPATLVESSGNKSGHHAVASPDAKNNNLKES